MNIAGWAMLAVGVIASLVFVACYALDQVPAICRKAVVAVQAVRALREELNPKPPEIPEVGTDQR